MICPECGNKCQRGIIECKNAGSLTQMSTMVSWYPEEDKGKFIRKNTVSLQLKATGYYCDECMKVFAAFNER